MNRFSNQGYIITHHYYYYSIIVGPIDVSVEKGIMLGRIQIYVGNNDNLACATVLPWLFHSKFAIETEFPSNDNHACCFHKLLFITRWK